MNLAMPIMNHDDKERFWSRVRIRNIDECWPWLGALGTGKWLTPNFPCSGKNYIAYRIAYYLTTNIDPKEKLICHTCDNSICCNPNHLFLGNHSINTMDSINKGRYKAGKRRIYNDYKMINSIREKYATGKFSMKNLAKDYGLGTDTVYRIIRGIGFKDLIKER